MEETVKSVTNRKIQNRKYADQANRLRALRAYFNLGSKDFAEAAGIQPKSYSQWESGDFRLSLSGGIQINQKYGVSLDWLYLGDFSCLSQKMANALAASEFLKKT